MNNFDTAFETAALGPLYDAFGTDRAAYRDKDADPSSSPLVTVTLIINHNREALLPGEHQGGLNADTLRASAPAPGFREAGVTPRRGGSFTLLQAGPLFPAGTVLKILDAPDFDGLEWKFGVEKR